jgi:aminomethyltransferase
VLQAAADVDLGDLRFFRLKGAKLHGIPVVISRTGYTGDLGYEVWLAAQDAERIWDIVNAGGKPFGIKPAGMLALDVARLEAGFILLEVDYIGAERALIPSQRYSPYEIGLSWTVDLKKDHFVGSRAIRKEDEHGPARQIVGLEIDLNEYERLFQQVGLPPRIPTTAWRGSAGIFTGGKQVGYATTGGWSPVLKKYIAIATLERKHANPGKPLALDVSVEHERKKVGVTVVKLPFYDPPRKRQMFNR